MNKYVYLWLTNYQFMKDLILEKIKEVRAVREDELIIGQIRGLIREGELKPGDKLPPERKLAERFGVGRGYVRLAIQRLEFYGILKIMPQSGTVVSELGITILDNLLGNILSLEDASGQALLESRKIIEVETVRLAAIRVTDSTLKRLQAAFDDHKAEVEKGYGGIEEDIFFHIRIAECAANPVLRSLIMVIAQDIIRQSKAIDSCSGNRKYAAVREHDAILKAIGQKDVEAVIRAMKVHLDNTKCST